MRRWMKRKVAFLRYGYLDAEVYQNILPDIADANLEMLSRASFWGLIIGIVLVPASFFIPSIARNRMIYVAIVLSMGALLIACGGLTRKHCPAIVLALCYGFLGAALLIGLVIGTFLNPNMPATTFCVLIFALPLLLIDRPWRMNLMIILAGCMFVVCSREVKTPAIASLDTVNACCFSFLSIFVNHTVLNIKLRDIANTRLIEAERDTDTLTRLYTRSATETCIQQYMATRRSLSALLVIDVDDFKQINDSKGHQCGDAALINVAKSLRGTFRHGDIIGRFGGDEFIVFLPDVGSVYKTKEKVTSLEQKLEDICRESHMDRVTLSIGVAHFPMDALNYAELFRKADKAVYYSKEKGKNCFTIYGHNE